MKAVLISGSPRAGGNTETLVTRCADRLRKAGIDAEVVSLRGKTIRGCTACGTCRKTRDLTCSIKTDDFHEVFDAMKSADILVVGSPVYFGSATPETMALLDRAGYVSRGNGNIFSRKIGGPIAVARRAGQNFTYAQILYWFTINDMIVPGSSYWNIAFGKGPGDVAGDDEGLQTVDRFTENIAWLAGKLQ
ncbi:MAG: flavodoxin family protein [Chitinivibrionales bacterium]|nr:flavodoxin family protein [Chitinivibrionales bacterium]MBD3396841.1 flavodoxin family protein [Chitinivibrionales bacterium]